MKGKSALLRGCLSLVIAAGLSAFTLGPAYAEILTHYSFEGDLADSAADGGSADDLTYVQANSPSGTPQFVPGVPGLGGQAVLFDGNYFTAPDSTDLAINDNSWTIEAFIHVTAPNPEWANGRVHCAP